MELELEFKLTKVLDDFTSANLLLAKQAVPVFSTRETETKFILSAHLKGCTRENIKININEEGTRIEIICEKPFKEIVMLGWKRVYKKEREMRGFTKAFMIPDGVVLDKIKARYNEDESLLTISMPKLVKGISGIQIEEVKEEEVAKEYSESPQIVADEVTERERLKREDYTESETKDLRTVDQPVIKLPEGPQTKHGEEFEALTQQKESTNLAIADKAQVVEQHRHPDEILQVESEMRGKESEKEETSQEIHEPKEYDKKLDVVETTDLKQATDKDQGIQEVSADDESSSGTEKEKNLGDQSTQTEEPSVRKSKLCVPMVAGSALFVSLIVFVIQWIRTKNQPSKNKQ